MMQSSVALNGAAGGQYSPQLWGCVIQGWHQKRSLERLRVGDTSVIQGRLVLEVRAASCGCCRPSRRCPWRFCSLAFNSLVGIFQPVLNGEARGGLENRETSARRRGSVTRNRRIPGRKRPAGLAAACAGDRRKQAEAQRVLSL